MLFCRLVYLKLHTFGVEMQGDSAKFLSIIFVMVNTCDVYY